MRVFDLTMRITPSIRVFPGSPQPSFIPWSRFDSHGYDSEAMFMSTHTDTHMDAPSHFVISTGWEKRAAKSNFMSDNPGLSGGAAKFLAKKKINAVAIDGPSIDAGYDGKFTAHNSLLPRNILIVENMCNVSKITTNRFTLIMSPLELGVATGSPARVLAIM